MLTDTMTSKKLNFKDGLFWTVALLVLLTNLLFSFILTLEIYQVSFSDIRKEYYWGADAFPWYYKNKQTCLIYIGSWTILFVTTLFFQVYFAFKDNKTKELYSGLLFILFFVAMLVVSGPMD